MALTLARAREFLAAWEAAELAVATGQEYSIAGRTLRRADADFIAKQVAFYRGQVDALTAGRGQGARVLRVMVRDL